MHLPPQSNQSLFLPFLSVIPVGNLLFPDPFTRSTNVPPEGTFELQPRFRQKFEASYAIRFRSEPFRGPKTGLLNRFEFTHRCSYHLVYQQLERNTLPQKHGPDTLPLYHGKPDHNPRPP